MAPRRHANRPRPREHSPYWNEVYAPIADLEKWKTDLYRHYLSAEADSDSGNWDLLLADAWVLLEYCEFLDEKLRREKREHAQQADAFRLLTQRDHILKEQLEASKGETGRYRNEAETSRKLLKEWMDKDEKMEFKLGEMQAKMEQIRFKSEHADRPGNEGVKTEDADHEADQKKSKEVMDWIASLKEGE